MSSFEFETRVAAYAVLVDEADRILLALWNEGATPSWTMPGGGLELHETAEEAAVREVREETGYDVELGPLLGIDYLVIPAEERLAGTLPAKAVRFVYAATITGGELTAEIGGSTEEARWIPLADVPALPHVGLVDASIAFWRTAREG